MRCALTVGLICFFIWCGLFEIAEALHYCEQLFLAIHRSTERKSARGYAEMQKSYWASTVTPIRREREKSQVGLHIISARKSTVHTQPNSDRLWRCAHRDRKRCVARADIFFRLLSDERKTQ